MFGHCFNRYFVPGDQSHEFLDFSAESIEKLDSALEARFEMLLQGQGSKTSAYDPQDLAKHILRQQPGAQALTLRKSLEEVAVSFYESFYSTVYQIRNTYLLLKSGHIFE